MTSLKFCVLLPNILAEYSSPSDGFTRDRYLQKKLIMIDYMQWDQPICPLQKEVVLNIGQLLIYLSFVATKK